MLDKVKEHYESVKEKHGNTHLGVGWKTEADQHDRLNALADLLVDCGSVNDWGCGYGAFREYLAPDTIYHGYDIVNQDFKGFVLSDKPLYYADYTVASGIFNVMDKDFSLSWDGYIDGCIAMMDKKSIKGFAFNMLSEYCDKRNPALFYGDPLIMFQRCRQYGLVTLNHSYSPFDFTILVKKEIK